MRILYHFVERERVTCRRWDDGEAGFFVRLLNKLPPPVWFSDCMVLLEGKNSVVWFSGASKPSSAKTPVTGAEPTQAAERGSDWSPVRSRQKGGGPAMRKGRRGASQPSLGFCLAHHRWTGKNMGTLAELMTIFLITLTFNQ